MEGLAPTRPKLSATMSKSMPTEEESFANRFFAAIAAQMRELWTCFSFGIQMLGHRHARNASTSGIMTTLARVVTNTTHAANSPLAPIRLANTPDITAEGIADSNIATWRIVPPTPAMCSPRIINAGSRSILITTPAESASGKLSDRAGTEHQAYGDHRKRNRAARKVSEALYDLPEAGKPSEGTSQQWLQ